ncbi:MAG: acyltransferase family protein, partial [Oscillospiraceae bacterium]|nr:acyltransferase family protein [Oscillospiraceae bacterium]
GMMFGKLDDSYRFSGKQIAFIEFLIVPGLILIVLFKAFFPHLLWTHGLYWYPSLLIVPAYCFNISFVLHALRNIRLGEILTKILNVLGANTFELFLVHIFIDDVLMEVYKDYPNQRLVWIIGTLAIVPGVLLLKKGVSFVNQIRSNHHVAAES